MTATELAGEPITAKLTNAPGNDAPIGGLKVFSTNGWFAARPSGTENVYKLYAESLKMLSIWPRLWNRRSRSSAALSEGNNPLPLHEKNARAAVLLPRSALRNPIIDYESDHLPHRSKFCPGISHALAKDYVLLDSDKPAQNWKITSQELGLNPEKPFSVSMCTLHGGRQEGVCIIDIDNGAMKISVVPTRGMNVMDAVDGKVRLGWDSPVNEVVNPAFIELTGRGAVGWLEGFNELVTRCGYEWVGYPGMDQGVMLPLHGLASNIPASKVVLSIDERPPYTITLKGELKEQAFKKVNFVIETELRTDAGAHSFSVHDTLINKGDYPKEYQAPITTTLVRPSWTWARVSALPSSRSHLSTKGQWESSAVGRPSAAQRAITTKPSTTLCPTAMKGAILWLCSITQPVIWALVWCTIFSSYPCCLCGKTRTLRRRGMSLVSSLAPALPTIGAINAP